MQSYKEERAQDYRCHWFELIVWVPSVRCFFCSSSKTPRHNLRNFMKLQYVLSGYLYRKKRSYCPTFFPWSWQITWPLHEHFANCPSVIEKLLLSECFSLYRVDINCHPNFLLLALVLSFGGTQTKLYAFSVC